jgi:hypothetical protein
MAPAEVGELDENRSLRVCNNLGIIILFWQSK